LKLALTLVLLLIAAPLKSAHPLRNRSVLYRDPQLDTIIRRVDQVLLRAQVALRRLHTGMAEQQLDLL